MRLNLDYFLTLLKYWYILKRKQKIETRRFYFILQAHNLLI
jgi:hypothetical protein